MAALKTIAVALALLVAAPASARVAEDPVSRWQPIIAEASQRFGLPEAWIIAVMRAESRGRTTLDGQPITSRAGAMGLMQLMPGTYAEMRGRLGLGPDPHDPRDNILAGAAYLRLMHDRFGYPGLFGAYNAGPTRYAEHLRTGRPLPGETRAYLAVLARMPFSPAMPPGILSGDRLFFSAGRATGQPPRQPNGNGIFVDLNTASDRARP
ncbi:putative lytic transglycosylase [Sphingobium sp. SYK-6]|uniref:lytic transglycosylase domain-containing protein n=1 Tax=Sphingobium sp. (strain NBRC 103272 / SYK-6) TaxID=627192 RepID=UPI0002277728|nr:lytic transglycosylase domain-containing protein [Sphingobium sp. SYK-6]BAK67289.1 putative lytic transglycosylase [Sphingobium sp. SYK-6]